MGSVAATPGEEGLGSTPSSDPGGEKTERDGFESYRSPCLLDHFRGTVCVGEVAIRSSPYV